MTAGKHNLARLAEASLARHGDRDALFFEDRWYRSGEMAERSRRLAGGLAGIGIKPGDRVVVMMSNTPDVGQLYIALWRAGAAITPAIFLLSEEELHNILVDSEARAVVTSPEFLPKVQQAAQGVSTLERIVCDGGGEGTVSIAELADATPLEVVDRDDTDLAALMYTGGTTGRA
jgi:long-chain acyl-CoA synthetase